MLNDVSFDISCCSCFERTSFSSDQVVYWQTHDSLSFFDNFFLHLLSSRQSIHWTPFLFSSKLRIIKENSSNTYNISCFIPTYSGKRWPRKENWLGWPDTSLFTHTWLQKSLVKANITHTHTQQQTPAIKPGQIWHAVKINWKVPNWIDKRDRTVQLSAGPLSITPGRKVDRSGKVSATIAF